MAAQKHARRPDRDAYDDTVQDVHDPDQYQTKLHRYHGIGNEQEPLLVERELIKGSYDQTTAGISRPIWHQ